MMKQHNDHRMRRTLGIPWEEEEKRKRGRGHGREEGEGRDRSASKFERSIAMCIKTKTYINPELKFTNKTIPEDDPRQRKPSIDLAKEILDWEPYIELEEGLKKTIAWFKKNL